MPALRVVGREQELQSLYRSYASMRKGNLSIVVVQGTSGIGKTCVVDAFLEDIANAAPENSAPLILRGRCNERETMPFKAFDSLIDSLGSYLRRLRPVEDRDPRAFRRDPRLVLGCIGQSDPVDPNGRRPTRIASTCRATSGRTISITPMSSGCAGGTPLPRPGGTTYSETSFSATPR